MLFFQGSEFNNVSELAEGSNTLAHKFCIAETHFFIFIKTKATYNNLALL